ncbi:MAG: transcriptional repressor LexA [Elusimicrobia bacterium]|nr:transcriptional repressor LexA [Elusimicrobiota bacterium]
MITEKQARILNFIQESASKNGYPPTIREICKKFSLSIGTIQWYLKKLEQDGHLRRAQGSARGLTTSRKAEGVPIVGKINAGQPNLAFEEIQGYVDPGGNLNNLGDLFALRVKGDSMTGAGILENDIVVVRKQASAENNDIVAALLEDEVTLKRLKKTNGHYALVPENAKYKPITGTDFRILGKVIKVLRDY